MVEEPPRPQVGLEKASWGEERQRPFGPQERATHLRAEAVFDQLARLLAR